MSVIEKHSSGETRQITAVLQLPQQDPNTKTSSNTIDALRELANSILDANKVCRHAMAPGSASCRQHPITAYNRPHEVMSVHDEYIHRRTP